MLEPALPPMPPEIERPLVQALKQAFLSTPEEVAAAERVLKDELAPLFAPILGEALAGVTSEDALEAPRTHSRKQEQALTAKVNEAIAQNANWGKIFQALATVFLRRHIPQLPNKS